MSATATARAVGYVPPDPRTNPPNALAPESHTWSPPALSDFQFVRADGSRVGGSKASLADFAAAERLHILSHFAIAPDRLDSLEGCRYPHHDYTDGRPIWKGVAQAMADLLRDASTGALEPALAVEAYDHLAEHYAAFKKQAPPLPAHCKAEASSEGKRFLPCRLEVKAVDEEKRTFEGLAATWDLDLGFDVIHPGAFRDTLADWRSSGKAMPLLDSHNYFSVFSTIGKLIEAKETKAGLWTKWQVIGGDDGDKVLDRLRAGVIDSMSIGYRPAAFDYSELEDDDAPPRMVRNLRKVDLQEVSLVVFPMNPAALVNLGTVKQLAASRPLEASERSTLETLHTELGRLLSAPPAPSPSGKESPNDSADEDPYSRLAQIRVQRMRLTSR